MTPLLSAQELCCSIGGRRVVDAVSLALRPGEWLALVGPNGAGKSTLLATLAGVVPASGGSVALDGRALSDWPRRERAQRLAWLAQAGAADGDLSVREVVRLGRLPRHGLLGAPDATDAASVRAALQEMEIEPLAERRLAALSGGERQRALLARVLAVGADVLLLDEPTAHLDAPHQRALVRGLRARAGVGAAVVTVLHDLGLALQADRVVVLAGGRVRADGAPSDPALQAGLEAAFDHAFAIVELPARPHDAMRPDGRAWPSRVAVPFY